jgi:hypothetical protein
MYMHMYIGLWIRGYVYACACTSMCVCMPCAMCARMHMHVMLLLVLCVYMYVCAYVVLCTRTRVRARSAICCPLYIRGYGGRALEIYSQWLFLITMLIDVLLSMRKYTTILVLLY